MVPFHRLKSHPIVINWKWVGQKMPNLGAVSMNFGEHNLGVADPSLIHAILGQNVVKT
jgi:hypothetical protein